jgi:hypothetical protein
VLGHRGEPLLNEADATTPEPSRPARPAGRRVAVSVLVSDSPSHAYGKRTLRLVFRALLRDLR